MRRKRLDERDRRYYRRRFPGPRMADPTGGDPGRGPLPRAAPGSERDLAVLAGYGPSTTNLALALADADIEILAFESYATALKEIYRLEPEAILVGQTERAGDVFHFLSRVGRVEWETVVLFLADYADPDRVNRALEHGVHDVVCPPHSVASILLRLHVTRRTRHRRNGNRERARRISLGRLTLDRTTRQIRDGDRPFRLTGRKFQLLVRLMEAGGDVVRREDLLEDIWGPDRGSTAVLDATVHRLRKELEETLGESDLVTTVRGVGYQLDLSEA